MPKIRVDIQGKHYELSPDSLEETFKKYPGMTVVMPDELPAQQEMGPKMNYARGLMRKGYQGFSFGLADEAEAGIDWLVEGKPYEKNLADIREQNAQFSKDNPWAAGISEFAGGIVGPGFGLVKGAKHLPTKKIPFTQQSLRPGGALAITGAAEGGLAGAGYSEADPGSAEFARDVATGTAVGGTLAPVGGWAIQKTGQVLSAAGQAIKNRVVGSDYDEAVRIIRRAIRADEISADEGQSLVDQFGKEGVLADAGPNLREAGRIVATKQSAGKKQAQDILLERQQGSQGRLAQAADDTIGAKWDNYHQFLNNTKAARETQAGPLFDAAFETTVDLSKVSPEFRELWSKPAVKKAAKKAQRGMANRMNSEKTGLDPNTDGISFRLMHETKRKLWDQEFALRKKHPQEANDIGKLRRTLTQELKDQSEDYDNALNIYAGGKQLDSAAEMGAQLLKGEKHFDDLEGVIAEFTDGEMDAFRVGAIKGIFNRIDKADLTHDSVKRLIGSTRVKKLLRATFKDEDSFTEFMARAAHEGEMTKTFNYSTQGRGSPTAATQEQERAMQEASGALADFTRSGGSLSNTAANVANRLFSKGDISEGVLNEMSKILFNKTLDADQINRIIGKAPLGALQVPTGGGAAAIAGALIPQVTDEVNQLRGSKHRRPGGALAQ